ncbi:hypothetical protein C2W62_47760, partial [Candidatus Entotheonella serta]
MYIDERADDAQRQAFDQILSGDMGGPMARFSRMTETFLGTRYVPITYTQAGKTRSV